MGNYLLYSLPIAIGFAAVVQGGLNQDIMKRWGIAGAVLLSNLQVLIWSLGLWLIARYATTLLSNAWRPTQESLDFYWWYLIPGLCGIFIVAGIPIAIDKLGAGKTFMAILLAQIIGGVIWDYFAAGKGISARQVAGIFVAAGGAYLMFE